MVHSQLAIAVRFGYSSWVRTELSGYTEAYLLRYMQHNAQRTTHHALRALHRHLCQTSHDPDDIPDPASVLLQIPGIIQRSDGRNRTVLSVVTFRLIEAHHIQCFIAVLMPDEARLYVRERRDA